MFLGFHPSSFIWSNKELRTCQLFRGNYRLIVKFLCFEMFKVCPFHITPFYYSVMKKVISLNYKLMGDHESLKLQPLVVVYCCGVLLWYT